MPRPAKGTRLWFDKAAGRWYIRDGTSKRGTGASLEERQTAEEALAFYIAGKYRPPETSVSSGLPVAAVLAYYYREIAAHHRTLATRSALAALNEWWGDKHLNDVKRSTCQAYVLHRTGQRLAHAKTPEARERRIKPATAGRELTVLRAAIRAYHAETPLDALPIVTTPPPAQARTRWLTRGEMARLLWATRAETKADHRQALQRFILIGVYTGTRTRAILELGWSSKAKGGGWIDLERDTLHRKGHEDVESKKRRPPVRIPRRLRHFLKRWYKADAKYAKAVPAVVHQGGHKLGTLRYAWERARDRAGLGPDVTAHTLRHTAATWMLQAGMSPWDAASYTGRSVEVLESVYGHHHPDFQNRAADLIGRRQ